MKFSLPRILLQLEGLAVLAVAVLLYARLDRGWSGFLFTFMAPDVALFGYLAGPRIGAVAYNAVHTYVSPLLLFIVLLVIGKTGGSWIVLVWAAHIGMDRLIGYGLRYESGGKDTHLSRV